MKVNFVQIALLLVISLAIVSTKTTEDRIRQHGYPAERHTVQTQDGYILTMFRIPHPQGHQTKSSRPVVFLQHGILSSSDCWILNGPGEALAYMLVEAGYDVWLGNNRGNTYSKRHGWLSPHTKLFWNFDWHEIALFDMPAMINYALAVAGQDSLHYVGHSQGTTVLLVMTSMIPSFNRKIKSAQLLAPVAFMDNLRGPIVEIATPFLGLPNRMVELFGSMEILPNDLILGALKDQMCTDNYIAVEVCSNIFLLVGGWNENSFNKALLSDIVQTHPAGASVNQIMHFLQGHVWGEFRQFDHGYFKNLVVYGEPDPPEYNLNNVEAPIFLYYSDNDYMSHPYDVHRLRRRLPNVRYSFRVPDRMWNHLDFLWSINVKEVVNNRLIANLKRMD